MTCFLIASKYDELDENIPMIKDLIRYYSRHMPSQIQIPQHKEVVESERSIMKLFNWNLMILTPTTFLKLLLANGVIFDSEEDSTNQKLRKNNEMLSPLYVEMARRISDRSITVLEFTIKEMPIIREIKPSIVAAAIVYIARQEEIQNMKKQGVVNNWCKELEGLTGYKESQIIEVVEKIRNKMYNRDKLNQSSSAKKNKNKENQSRGSPSKNVSSCPNSNSKFPNPPNSAFTAATKP